MICTTTIITTHAYMFLIPSTNYNIIYDSLHETHFTYATQDPNHGVWESQKKRVGLTDDNTP
jgi:hypothetical protein